VNCCTPTGYRTIFGAKAVERDARRYRRKGLTGSAQWLFHALDSDGVSDASVLEVGGGIGDVQIELLKAGASQAANVEIIDSYEATARTLITEHNLDARVDRHIGDFAQNPDQTATADIVIMHRVICCYPDSDALITAACGHAHDRVAITVTRGSWWVKLGFSLMNAWLRLRRIAFRGYVHPLGRMVELAGRHGYHTTHQERGALWESLILNRRRAEANDPPARAQ
jgi:magnesium-protoporphyrin O-methyltransferase